MEAPIGNRAGPAIRGSGPNAIPQAVEPDGDRRAVKITRIVEPRFAHELPILGVLGPRISREPQNLSQWGSLQLSKRFHIYIGYARGVSGKFVKHFDGISDLLRGR